MALLGLDLGVQVSQGFLAVVVLSSVVLFIVLFPCVLLLGREPSQVCRLSPAGTSVSKLSSGRGWITQSQLDSIHSSTLQSPQSFAYDSLLLVGGSALHQGFF